MDVTVVIAATSFLTAGLTFRFDRLSFLHYFAQRWKGFLIATIKVDADSVANATQAVAELRLPPKFTVILYIVEPKDPDFFDFPVNRLRNIGIRNVRTTHFLMLDMDMWPSRVSTFLLSV